MVNANVLAIASVLATNPTVLVLDEPTSSLDPDGTAELYRLVGDLNQKHGITVVVIDHDLHAVLPYANRMALMVDGSVACDDGCTDYTSLHVRTQYSRRCIAICVHNVYGT